MPTVTQLAPASTLGFGTLDTPIEQLGEAAAIAGSTLRHQSSTGFMWGLTAPIGNTGNHIIYPGSIIVQGSGFAYGNDAIPDSGTIDSIMICIGGQVFNNVAFAPTQQLLWITGLSMNIADLGDELFLALAGNPAPLENYFLNLPWSYNGSNGQDSFEGGNLVDSIKGNGSNDYLYGNGGADKLYGGDGDDGLYGGAGADYLSGGTGFDTAQYYDAPSGVVASLANPSINTGYAAGDTYNSIEGLWGSAYADALNGNNGANTILARHGNDTVKGYAGDDFLAGEWGNDTLIGGAGADQLNGGDNTDTASYAGAAARVTVSLANPSINTGYAAGDTYNSIEGLWGSAYADALNGNNGANTILARHGNDTVKGYAGDDFLAGEWGNDTLIGGAGADQLNGGDNTDTASYAGAAARVTVSLANPSINSGDAAGDTFSSIENLTGTNFHDYVYGNNAANVIDGGAGNDVLKGYGGNDTLKGWTGKDIFVFNSALNAMTNVDTLADYNAAADTIQLDNAVFTALTATGTLAASAFKDIAGGVKDSNDRIIYNSDTGALYYDRDGSGGTYGNVKFAVVETHAHLTAADFVVI